MMKKYIKNKNFFFIFHLFKLRFLNLKDYYSLFFVNYLNDYLSTQLIKDIFLNNMLDLIMIIFIIIILFYKNIVLNS